MKFNRKNPEHLERVRNVIYRACVEGGSKGADWADIVNRLGSMFSIKNWMHVRYVLQAMRDERIVTRIDDVHRERYALCSK